MATTRRTLIRGAGGTATLAVTVALLFGGAPTAVAAPLAAGDERSETVRVEYTGARQTVAVPDWATKATILAQGGSGGDNDCGRSGGTGSVVRGIVDLNVTTTETFSVAVGGQGESGRPNGRLLLAQGGWGADGASGGSVTSDHAYDGAIASGGGATSVAIGDEPIVVAGGGGGAGVCRQTNGGDGGAGGSLGPGQAGDTSLGQAGGAGGSYGGQDTGAGESIESVGAEAGGEGGAGGGGHEGGGAGEVGQSLMFAMGGGGGGGAGTSWTGQTVAEASNARGETDTAGVSITFTGVRTEAPVDLDADRTEMVGGDPLTLTATLPSRATGTVDFLHRGLPAGSQLIASAPVGPDGKASVTSPAVPGALGTHNVTAAYSGDDRHVPSSSDPLTMTVKTRVDNAWLQLSHTQRSGTVSWFVHLPADATGTVTFHDEMMGGQSLGTATVSGGRAMLSQTDQPLFIGQHRIWASYSGDATYMPVETAPVDLRL